MTDGHPGGYPEKILSIAPPLLFRNESVNSLDRVFAFYPIRPDDQALLKNLKIVV